MAAGSSLESTTLVILSDEDVVARALGARWGSVPATGMTVDGAELRRLDERLLTLRRPGRHIFDERLDELLPPTLRALRPTLLFPSIHRSESGQRCFTVHPLGNPGPHAQLGGQPRTLVPTNPRAMAGLLRELGEAAQTLGLRATYEATHHGPELELPALFAEVAVPEGSVPTDAEIAVIDRSIRAFRPDPRDRVALAVGGGHYAPRFGDLTRARQWAFGHIISRHALADLDPATARAGLEGTPGAEGILYARAQDRGQPAFDGLGPELRETDAPRRTRRDGSPTSTSLPTSGT